MSSTVVKTFLFRCDGPLCDTSETTTVEGETPDGWRIVTSKDHIPPSDRNPYWSGTKAVRWVSEQGARTNGWFRIHLCPRHLAAFDGHLPVTDGVYHPNRRGEARVGCSCGAKLGLWSADYRVDQVEGEPRLWTARAWWQHLPVELQSYTRPWDRMPV